MKKSNYLLAVPPLSGIGLGRGNWAKKSPSRASGFTLAEVLITLVIIGVVAALTIPNLLQKYQEQTTVKKVQKFYSTVSNAYSIAMKENGPVDGWELIGWNIESKSNEKIYNILFKPYFKIAKNCGLNNTGNCMINGKYKYLDNSEAKNYGTSPYYYKVLLDDGAAVLWIATEDKVDICYDVNGQKGPNQWGKDTFEFVVRKDAVVPTGLSGGKYAYQSFNVNCVKSTSDSGYGNGWGCAAWVIYKGNMDYLHCDGLKWTSRSCKEK